MIYLHRWSFVWIVVFACFLHGFSQKESSAIEMDFALENLIQFKIEQDKKLYANFHYTIQIGFGTLDEMNLLRRKFRQIFPYVVSRIIFETPNYKLQVGKNRSQVILHRLLREVKLHFPEAFLLERKMD